MQQWEYLYVWFRDGSHEIQYVNGQKLSPAVAAIDYLNMLGAHGWELVGTLPKSGEIDMGGTGNLFFKRPKQ